jgi:hypothetical protein
MIFTQSFVKNNQTLTQSFQNPNQDFSLVITMKSMVLKPISIITSCFITLCTLKLESPKGFIFYFFLNIHISFFFNFVPNIHIINFITFINFY